MNKISNWIKQAFANVAKDPGGRLLLVTCLGFGGLTGFHSVDESPDRGVICTTAECWTVDTCTNTLGCHKVGTVWQIVMPANKLLFKSGTPIPIVCQRLTYDGPGCVSGRTRDDYPAETCGVEKIVIGEPE